MKIDDLLLMVYYMPLYTIIIMAKAYHCRTPGNPWIGSTDGFAVLKSQPPVVAEILGLCRLYMALYSLK